MATTKEYQHQGEKNQHRLIQTLNDSLQELLYSHIDHLFKQWIKTFYNAVILITSLGYKFFFKNRVQVPEYLLNVSLSPEQREVLSKGQETKLISGFISKKGNMFSAYIKFNEAGELKFRFPEKNVQEIPVEFLGVKLSNNHLEQLKNGKETTLIEGLKGKRGIPFSGFLSIGEEGKIKIRFPIRDSVGQGCGITVQTPVFTDNDIMSVQVLPKVRAGQNIEQPNAFEKPTVHVLPKEAAVNLQDQPNAFDQPLVQVLPNEAALNTQEQSNAYEQPPVFNQTNQTDSHSLKAVTANLTGSADLSDLEVYGRKISTAEAKLLVSTGKTPLLDGFKTVSGKVFSATLVYTNHKLSIHIPQRSINTGICMLPKKIFGVEISDQSRRLLSGGRSTSLIENMISPSGIRFSGWLKFDQAHRLSVRSAEQIRGIHVPGKTPKSTEKGLTG